MDHFLEQHQHRIVGVLSGFDRIMFRGLLLPLVYWKGFDGWLGGHGVLYKHFAQFVQRVSQAIKQHAREVADKCGRPFIYISSSNVSKEDLARRIMEQDEVEEGLVCVLSCVEPCNTYAIRRDARAKEIHLVHAERKCLHLYFYYHDREFGLMHVRIQTWFPLTLQVCLNGREYLAKRLERARIRYHKQDNCFVWIEDLPRAQKMLDDLNQRRWSRFLGTLARRVNPWLSLRNPLKLRLPSYYWTMRQSEYATDVMFRDAGSLQAVYPALVNHAIQCFRCEDALRFLGRRTNSRFSGNVSCDVKHRPEGVRVKHRVEENSIKMYDKCQCLLRIETTINNPQRFKAYRPVTRQGQRVMAWVALRKGLADIRRRVEVCRAANERYLEALAAVGEPSPTRHLLDPVSRRITRQGRSYRALRPVEPSEAKLFTILLSGEFHIHGFRNRDIRSALLPRTQRNPSEQKKTAARVTRLLRLLRAHRLIRKVPGTFSYRVTPRGTRVMATALRLREIDLNALAA